MKKDTKKSTLLFQLFRDFVQRGVLSREELLRRYDLDDRTLQRYLQDLEEFGVQSRPQVLDARKKEYYLEDRFRGPVDLNEEEAAALSMASSILEGMHQSLAHALKKLLKREQNLKLEGVRIGVFLPGLARPQKTSRRVPSKEWQDLKTCFAALKDREMLLVDGKRVYPGGLFLHEYKWLLLGQMVEGLEFVPHVIRLDRVKTIRRIPEKCDLKDSSDVETAYGPSVYETPEKVVLKIHGGRGRYFFDETYHPSQKIESGCPEDSEITVSYLVNDLRYFKFFVRRWLPHAEVLEPASLRKQIQEELKLALKCYED